MENNIFQYEMRQMRHLEVDFLLEYCTRAFFDGGIIKAHFAEEATGVFLELNMRHAPSGEQLHGRPLHCLSD